MGYGHSLKHGAKVQRSLGRDSLASQTFPPYPLIVQRSYLHMRAVEGSAVERRKEEKPGEKCLV